MRSFLSVVVCAVLVVGCGAPEEGGDAGPDGSVDRPDASGGPDAGGAPDAGGGGVDAGTPDAGPSCDEGFASCGDDPWACETDLTSLASCGACERACLAVDHATATCNGTACGFTCDENFGDCDDDASNGCETDLRTSAAHCGGCGDACEAVAGATVSCADSTCGFTCEAAFGDCDEDPLTGCEQPLDDDAHCSACNTTCPPVNGSSVFCTAARTCGSSCTDGKADCDESAANGCEVTLATSTDHCGACNNACPSRADAVTTCVTDESGSACDFNCLTGFDDCDGQAENGCEAALDTELHCGACNNACTGGSSCLNGACVACALPTEAITLVPGTPATFTATASGTSAISSTGCQSTTNGPEKLYAFTLAAPTAFVGETTGYDTVLSLRTGCEDEASEVACNDDANSSGTNSVVRTLLQPGDYYAVVDKYSISPSTAAVNLTAKFLLYEALAHTTCATARPLTTAGLAGEELGRGLPPATERCVDTATGPALHYTYTVPANTKADITVTPSSTVAAFVRVLDSCAATACLSNASGSTNGTARTVTVENRGATPRPVVLQVQAYKSEFTVGTVSLGVVETALPVAPGNAECAGATPLTFGTTLSGQSLAVGGNPVTVASCGSYTGAPLYYSLDVPAQTEVSVTVTPPASGFDPTIRVIEGCAATPVCVVNKDAGGSGTTETVSFTNTSTSPRTYIVIVSDFSRQTVVGTFSVRATATTLAPNSSCATPRALVVGDSVTGENCQNGGPVNTACSATSSGKVLYYRVSVASNASARVTVTPSDAGSTFKPLLRALANCSATTCDQTASNTTAGGTAGLSFLNTGATPAEYLLAVSGTGTTSGAGIGNFTIAVTPEEIQTNGSCAGATELPASGVMTSQDLSTGGPAFSASGCATSSTKTLWFKRTVPARSALAIRVQPQTAWDPVVRVLLSCSATSCDAGGFNNVSGNSLAEPLLNENATDAEVTMWFNVAGATSTIGVFDMETWVLAYPPGNGLTCALATSGAALALPTVQYGNNSTNSTSIVVASCNNNPGPKVAGAGNGVYAYKVVVPAGQRLVARAIPLTVFNIQVRLYDGTCPSSTATSPSCVAASDVAGSSVAGLESFTWTNTTASDKTMYVLVAGNSTSNSTPRPFALDLSLVTP